MTIAPVVILGGQFERRFQQDKILTYHLLKKLKSAQSEKAVLIGKYPMGFSIDVREKLELLDQNIKTISENIKTLNFNLQDSN